MTNREKVQEIYGNIETLEVSVAHAKCEIAEWREQIRDEQKKLKRAKMRLADELRAEANALLE